ncbi:MAG: alpha/beta hydrolase family protein [Rhodomicrobiaceae bacterium]
MSYMGRAVAFLIIGLASLAAMSPLARASRIQTDLSVDSKLLHKSIAYSVYIPDDPAPAGGWPVLYLLHGLNGNEQDWLKAGGVGEVLDEMIGGKTLPPMVVVMPMAGNSWYVDDARQTGLGPVATAMLSEFIPEVEKRYAIAGCRDARAIGGASMGGYGALLYALERPDLFGAAISLSGSIFPEAKDLDPAREMLVVSLVRGVFGEPFSRERYQAWNLFPKLRRLGSQAIKPVLFLAASDGDYPRQLLGATTFQIAAISAGFKSELRVDNGSHSWRYWGRAIRPALSWLSGALPFRCQ